MTHFHKTLWKAYKVFLQKKTTTMIGAMTHAHFTNYELPKPTFYDNLCITQDNFWVVVVQVSSSSMSNDMIVMLVVSVGLHEKANPAIFDPYYFLTPKQTSYSSQMSEQ